MLKNRTFNKVYSNGKKAVDDLGLMVEPGGIYGSIGYGQVRHPPLGPLWGFMILIKERFLSAGTLSGRSPCFAKKKMAFLDIGPL